MDTILLIILVLMFATILVILYLNIKSKKDEIIFKLDLSTKEELEIVKKRLEILEKKLNKKNKSTKIKKVKKS